MNLYDSMDLDDIKDSFRIVSEYKTTLKGKRELLKGELYLVNQDLIKGIDRVEYIIKTRKEIADIDSKLAKINSLLKKLITI